MVNFFIVKFLGKVKNHVIIVAMEPNVNKSLQSNPLTFILFGKSGCGKGTQADLIIEKVKASDPRNIFYLETGQKLREFAQESSLTSKNVKKIMASGGLLPEFLPIWIWTEYMIRHMDGSEHMVLDGLSRRVEEAPILDSAMKFYDRKKPFVIEMVVSDEWATERLLSRKRGDDTVEDVKKRIAWYHDNVAEAIKYFKDNDYYQYVAINGEQTIAEVHAEIMAKTGMI